MAARWFAGSRKHWSPGPHEHLGYKLNFWQYVTAIDSEADPAAAGTTLHHCHEILRSFTGLLSELAILTESLTVMETLARRGLFLPSTLRLLEKYSPLPPNGSR